MLYLSYCIFQTLKRKEREYEHEMEKLAREKIAHQQHLSTLKKELSARWDHIDFSTIVPDMASLEQQQDKETKSTTTASEQPDLDDNTDSLTLPTVSATSEILPYTLANSPSISTVTACTTESNTIGLTVPRDPYPDLNQPLNLSTSPVESRGSPRRLPSPAHSPKHTNGEWSGNQVSLNAVYAHRVDEEVWTGSNVGSISVRAPNSATNVVRANVVSTTSQVWPISTTLVRTLPTATTNVVRTLPSTGNTIVRSLPVSSTTSVRAIPTTLPSSVRPLPGATNCPVRSSTTSSSSASTSISDCPHTHSLPIVGAGGIQLPAQIVAGSVQLNGTTSGLLGQPAIQVIPPEGYKLLPADHTANGTKPLTITLAQTGNKKFCLF